MNNGSKNGNGEKMKNVTLESVSKIDGSERVVNLFAKTGESTIAVNTCYNGSSDMTFGFESVTDWQLLEMKEDETVQNVGSYLLPVDCDLVLKGTIDVTELPDLLYQISEICEPVVGKAIESTQLARDRRL